MSKKDSKNCKHKDNGKRLYRIWITIRQRCHNHNDKEFYLYGERGIGVCEGWNNDFTSFYEWSIENGYNENLSIDRKDVNGNYEPSNCRWATPKEQANNRRDNNLVTIEGVTKTVVEWEREYNLPRDTVRRRVKAGYEGQDLLKSPKKAEKQSGVKGIAWRKDIEKWEVRTSRVGGFVGFFDDLEEATKKRSEAL